jgi:hypothetical protein
MQNDRELSRHPRLNFNGGVRRIPKETLKALKNLKGGSQTRIVFKEGEKGVAMVDTIEELEVKEKRGLGSTIERLIKKITGGKVKTCGGCGRRRDKLNKIFPYNNNNDNNDN